MKVNIIYKIRAIYFIQLPYLFSLQGRAKATGPLASILPKSVGSILKLNKEKEKATEHRKSRTVTLCWTINCNCGCEHSSQMSRWDQSTSQLPVLGADQPSHILANKLYPHHKRQSHTCPAGEEQGWDGEYPKD